MDTKKRVSEDSAVLKHFLNLVMFPLNSYPAKSSFRNTTYLIQGFLIVILAYLWLEYTQMDGMFKSVYPWIIAVIVVATHYLIVEIGGRFIYKRSGPFVISMATFWAISLAGVFIGFLMVYFNAQCPGVEKIYPDIFYFYSDHPDPRPGRFSVFYKIILIPWALSMVVLTQGELKRKLDRELLAIRQINDELKKRTDDTSTLDDRNKPNDNNKYRDQDCFCITSNDGNQQIPFIDIYYISVADHYCELLFKKEGTFYRELIRLSLKEAMANLPPDLFEQVHRSHVVNLGYVKKINRSGQSYKLEMADTRDLIPASRHRVRNFLPKLKTILNT